MMYDSDLPAIAAVFEKCEEAGSRGTPANGSRAQAPIEVHDTSRNGYETSAKNLHFIGSIVDKNADLKQTATKRRAREGL